MCIFNLKQAVQRVSIMVRSLLLVPFIMALSGTAEADRQMKIALDDLPGIDMLNILIAVERARERGENIKIVYLQSEGITAQAITNGQADIGMGTPYGLIQKTGAPIRMFYQLNTLRFHPIVNADYYQGWKDLDGIVMHTHGAGSGTEAIMNMMAKRHGIQYSEMKYIPGSGVRAKAMLQRRIKATIVDTERRNLLLKTKKGNFKLLPMPKVDASDEAIYASKKFIKENRDSLRILVEELLYVWRETNKSPNFINEMREHYNLLPRLNDEKIAEIPIYFREMVEVEAFSNDGGFGQAFRADVDFYGFSGTLTGEVDKLKEADFWDFGLLREVLAAE